jgi:putative transposase
MPKGLVRFQNCGVFHFITFSCYRREPLLAQRSGYFIFEEALERVRQSYRFVVAGYVLMPEHVHLLVNEPQKGSLATAIQVLKQTTSKKLKQSEEQQFWQRRYYDFNVWTDEKRIEKLRYMHLNPVRRGLTATPQDWPWSSFRHSTTGIEGTVEVESFWTAHKREQSTGRLDKILPSHP